MDEQWVLNGKPAYIIFYNSANVRLFSSCAEASIVIHQWFHAGWEVQHTVHQVAEAGGTCTYTVIEHFIPSLTNVHNTYILIATTYIYCSKAYPTSALALLLC